MVPKVTPYDVDLGPVCFLSRPSSCLRDKHPKQYPTVEHSKLSKNVRQEDSVAVVLESVQCPGGGGGGSIWATNAPSRIITFASGEWSEAR